MDELKPCDITLLEKRLKNLSAGLKNMDNGDIMVNRAMLTACRDYMAELLTLRRAEPENKALTVEQLKQMNGESVWIALLNIAKQPTCEVITKICEDGIHTVGTEGSNYASFDLYGKTWLPYARKPEGSEHP